MNRKEGSRQYRKPNLIIKRGSFIIFITTEKSTANKTQGETTHAEPVRLRKRIGSTLFIVNVHFSKTAKETMEGKILRLIEREVCNAV